MLAQLICQFFISQGSKKAVYFFYSADLGGVLLFGFLFLIFGGSGGGFAFIAALAYALYFFHDARKSYTDEDAATFATNLLKWSAISLPVDCALVALSAAILFAGLS